MFKSLYPPFRYHDQNLRKFYCVPELLFHSYWIHFYISLTKKSLKWKPFVAVCRQWNVTAFSKIWMWWFPVQDWSLWVPVALSFRLLLVEARLWSPNPSSLMVTGHIYAPLRTFMVCRATNLPAPATFSTSGPNILHHCSFNMHHFRYMDWQDLMLASIPWILFAIYFLPKLNSNFIPKQKKGTDFVHFLLPLSCLVSLNCRQNLTFSFRLVLPTTGPRNKLNSKTITTCIVMLVMTAANIWSCKNTLVCCCERWDNSIQDCTAETWVDYCQLGEDCSFSLEMLKLQCRCCLKFRLFGTLLHAWGLSSSFLMGSGQWTVHNYRHTSTSSPGKYQLFVYCRYTTNRWYLELEYASFQFLEDEIYKQEAMSRTRTAYLLDSQISDTADGL